MKDTVTFNNVAVEASHAYIFYGLLPDTGST